MMGERAVIIAACRTPFTRLDGALARWNADDLAARVIAELHERVPDVVPDDVLMATATGPGGNLARRALLAARLPQEVPGITLDRQCGGGLDAVALACRLIESGAGRAYVAGGVESPSTSPLRSEPSSDARLGSRDFFPRNAFAPPDVRDPGMAEAAEELAQKRRISRERQDDYAALSHARAAVAQRDGTFAGETALCVRAGTVIASDKCPRPRLTADRMARMPPLVHREGSVAVGNASQIADGAAAVLVVAESVARVQGRPGIRHLDSVTVGGDPSQPHLGAISAARALARRDPTFAAAAATQVAMTEAFAVQMLATIDDLKLDAERVNPRGGAIALGHPWAASGAMQVVRLATELSGDESASGLALAAIAGGMGAALHVRGWCP